MEAILLVMFNSILLVSGQILWKIGLRTERLNSIGGIIHALFSKYIFGGIVIYGFATIFWLMILQRYDLTKVYPLQSMCYILALIAGYFILHEPVTRNTIMGSIVVCVGIYIMFK